MTDTDKLRELLAKATKTRLSEREWRELPLSIAEIDLREALVDAAPELLDELDRLRTDNERLRAALAKISDAAAAENHWDEWKTARAALEQKP